MAKKQNAVEEPASAVEVPEFKPTQDYRIHFRNGHSTIAHGHALVKGLLWPLKEIASIVMVGKGGDE